MSDDWTWDLQWNVNAERSGAAWVSSNNVTGKFGGKLDGPALTNPFGDFEGNARRHWYGMSLKNEVKFADGTLSVIGGYDQYAKRFFEELDFRNDKPITFFGTPFFPNGIQPIAQPVDLRAWTGEARYTSSDSAPIRWIAGAFVQDSLRKRVDDFGPLLFGAEASAFRTPTTQVAAFGQVTASLADQLEATLALRYDNVKTSEDMTGVTTKRRSDFAQKTFGQVQPKLSLAYNLSPQSIIYANMSRGFKPGGFNPQPGPTDTFKRIYKAETTTAIEVGAKTASADGRVSATASAFYTDYANFQYFAFINGNDTTYTAPKVKVKGFEFSVTAKPSPWLALDSALSYTDAKIGNFSAPNPVSGVGLRNYTGKQTPNSPRYNLATGAEVDWPLSGGLIGSVRGELTVRGKTFFEIDNALYSPTEAALNLRVAVRSDDWTAAIWAKNLTNNRWAVSAFGQGQIALLAFLGPNGPFDSFNINRGRQYGVTLKANF